jgi:predicted DsbA family dithiol-disulfide isomerase
MEIKIWSDVRCPFCYIGKRKFEQALEGFAHKDDIKISWKSFQLDPNLKTDPSISTIEYFVQNKGVSHQQAEQMLRGATQMGAEIGLTLDFENSVLANSFNAHRLIQMAKSKGLGNEIEEALFEAHFEKGKNIDSHQELVVIGSSIGMDKDEIEQMLQSDDFAYQVKQDELEARNIGVRGVPFFVFNDKFGVSGAQSPEVFLQTLDKAWDDFSKNNSGLEIIKGDSCSTDGICD